VTIISPSKKATKGRPKLTKDDIEQMRDHIAACALRLFHEDGFDAISMRKIAKVADLTPMTIYRYFDGKIDILSKIWIEIFAELFDELEAHAKAEKNSEQRLRKAALGYVNYWLENREHYFLVFTQSRHWRAGGRVALWYFLCVENFSIVPRAHRDQRRWQPPDLCC
jgi:AcrR family transcriptional regulator